MIDALLHRQHPALSRHWSDIAGAYTLQRAGIAHTQDEVQALVAAIERLKPFPDVVTGTRTTERSATDSWCSRTATPTC